MGYATRHARIIRTGLKAAQAQPVRIQTPPRLNRYTCNACGGHIITVDRDKGVTPFAIDCRATRGCSGDMYSSFYRVSSGTPTFEWRKPTPEEYAAMSAAGRHHVDQGGLELHPINGRAV